MNAGAWQPDPTQRHELRWWDGGAWTDHVSDHGVAGMDAVQHPTVSWAPPATSSTPWTTTSVPTVPPPTTAILVAQPSGAPRQRRVGLMAAGLLAVVGLGVAGVILLGGDDKPSGDQAADTAQVDDASTTVAPSTVAATTPTTAAPTTVAPTTMAPTTVAPTTTVVVPTTFPSPTATSAQLIAAMPQADDVPASWTLGRDADPAPPAATGPGEGFCGAGNAVARAQDVGRGVAAGGPAFDIDGGGWFSIDAYAFGTAEAAVAFMQATAAQVTGCTTAATYQESEAEFDMFIDGQGDAATWTFTEMPLAEFVPTTDADESLQINQDISVTTNDAGVDYSLMITELSQYQRHGNLVLVYTLEGWWGFTGFDGFNGESEPEWAFFPEQSDVTTDASIVRPMLLIRLTEQGVL